MCRILASAFMLVATLKKVRDDKEWLRRHLPFLLLALGCAAAAFFGPFIVGPIIAAFCRAFGIYTVVQERQCRVYMLFGKVKGVMKVSRVRV